MPYKNTVWVKLEKRLLHDYRWLSLSEGAQLLYIKLILGATHTANMIPKVPASLALLVGYKGREDYLLRRISEIKRVFPKFKENSKYYYFQGFEEKTNWIDPKNRELPRNSQGTPRVTLEKEKEKEKDKEGDTDTKHAPTLLEVEQFCLKNKDIVEKADFNFRRWFHYHEAKNWMVGNNKMTNWKASIKYWIESDLYKKQNEEQEEEKKIWL